MPRRLCPLPNFPFLFSIFANSFVCHTSAKSNANSFPCDTSKNPSRKSFICHTSKTPGAMPSRGVSSRACLPVAGRGGKVHCCGNARQWRHPEPKGRDLLSLFSFSLLPYVFASFLHPRGGWLLPHISTN